MIRWARSADDKVAAVADTLEEWRAAWLRMWCPATPGDRLPSGRRVLVAAGPAGLSRGSDRLGPGTRLVVIFEHSIADVPPTGGIFELFAGSDWSPELAHLCDPLPGDPRATAAWRERERILIEPSGRTVIGAVWSKRLQPAEAATARFLPGPGADLGRDYFPLPADGRLPLPERLTKGEAFGLGDLAAAFGMPPRDAIPIVDELLGSEAISLLDF